MPYRKPEDKEAMFLGGDGRWRINCLDGSTMFFYRAVMQNHIGRPLLPTEHVHHSNGDKGDDRIENLELLDIREHAKRHAGEGARARRANWKFTWSRNEPECRECGTTEAPHYCIGLCRRCYRRLYMRNRRTGAVAA